MTPSFLSALLDQNGGLAILEDDIVARVDDHSRITFSQIKPDEKADSAVPFLKAAVAYYKSLGIKVERVMTDNGPCYKSFAFRDACIDLGIKHIRTKPWLLEKMGRACLGVR